MYLITEGAWRNLEEPGRHGVTWRNLEEPGGATWRNLEELEEPGGIKYKQFKQSKLNILHNFQTCVGAARRTHTYMLCCSSERRGAKKTLMLFWITMIWAGGKSTCENKSHINSKPILSPHWSGRAASRRAKINQIYFRNLQFFATRPCSDTTVCEKRRFALFETYIFSHWSGRAKWVKLI